MKKLGTYLLSFLLFALPAAATTLSGTITAPDSSHPTGSLWFELNQAANLTGGGCGSGTLTPGTPAVFTLTNGVIAGPGGGPYTVIGNDCLSPATTYYRMTVITSDGATALRKNVSITGSSADIGTLPSPGGGGGGGGGGTLSGDVTGPLMFANVVGLQGVPMVGTAPTTGQVLGFNGSTWGPGPVSLTGALLQNGSASLTAPWSAGNFRIDSQNSTRWFNIRANGAVGDGSRDDSTAIQAALTAANAAGGGTVYFPSGSTTSTYMGKNLIVYSNTTLLGDGRGSVLKLYTSGGAITDVIIRNNTTGSYTDTNIAIVGLTIDGNNAGVGGSQTRFTAVVQFQRVTNLWIRDCWLTNLQYYHTSIGACRRVLIDGNLFTTCGYQGSVANGGGPLWVSGLGTDPSQDVRVVNNGFVSNYYTTLFAPIRGVFANNNIYDSGESGVFISQTAATGVASRELLIANNVIDTVHQRYISASGIECASNHASIIGNTIRNTDQASIALENVQYVNVTGNTCLNASQAGSGIAGTLGVLSTAASPNQTKNILIADNIIGDDTGSVLAANGIGIWYPGGAASAMSNVIVKGNNIAPVAWTSGLAIQVEPASIDDTCNVYDARLLFSQTANSTTTANTLTTIFGTGTGTLTIPQNFFLAGKGIRVKYGGYISAADGAVGTHTLTVTLGGTTVATGTSVATFASFLNGDVRGEVTIECRTLGTTGTVQSSGRWETQIAGSNAYGGVSAVSTGTTTINTTGALVLNVKMNNGNATGTATTTWATVEALN